MREETQVIIVGAGPAGIASAIYLRRAGRELMLLEREELGGLLRNANLVENYPGFPKGIRGTDLVNLFSEQLGHLSVKATKAEAKSIELHRGLFQVRTQEDVLASRTLILATGTRPKRLPLKGADGLLGERVFSEVVDMPLGRISGKRVVIIGGGDGAFDYGLNLTGRGAEVTIVSRSEPTCLSLLKARAEASGIGVMDGATVDRLREMDDEVSVSLNDGRDETELRADYILVACGREPNIEVLGKALRSRIGDGKEIPRTNVQGLFMAGDVVRGAHRQTAIAVGDGVHAAMLADAFLNSMEEDE